MTSNWIDHSIFYRDFVAALREDRASFFVGAGISRAAGFVDWKQLLRDVADELHLDIDQESDLVAVAQYHVNNRGTRDRLNQLLIDEFLEDATLTESHGLIASLPSTSVWTTNYDDLLESAFTSAGKRIDVKRRQSDFATFKKRAHATIYKMHGDKTDPSEAVLTKSDYEGYGDTREVFTAALKGELTTRTFLFLGFSFSDPNVAYILARVRQLLGHNSRTHYALIKEPSETDSTEYERRRFPHWLADLKRYHVHPVRVQSYAEIPRILAELKRRCNLRTVFISGSNSGQTPIGERFVPLCQELAAELIRKGYNIISGFGLGVGDHVIVGATSALGRNDDDRLQLWPFPQAMVDPEKRAEFWRQYRTRMLAGAGVCIVLAGNKLGPDGVIGSAPGVREEVEIARLEGKPVIPVGATGGAAAELWNEAVSDPSGFLPGMGGWNHLQELGSPTAPNRTLIDSIIAILKALDR